MDFKELEQTGEYCETHYYRRKEHAHDASNKPIEMTSFWADAAAHVLKSGSFADFLSANFIWCPKDETTIVAALSLLDLPWTTESHGYKPTEGQGLEIKAANNMIVFQKAVKEAQKDLQNDVLVNHRYFQSETPQQQDATANQEFLIGKAYTC